MARFTTIPKKGQRAAVECQDCGGDLSEWPKNVEVRHCNGVSFAFGTRRRGEPHHAQILYNRCWLCHMPLGCRNCSGIEKELLCENAKAHGDLGAVWATKAAFLEHGPFMLQPMRNKARAQKPEDYPADWARLYKPTMQSATPISDLINSIGKEIA